MKKNTLILTVLIFTVFLAGCTTSSVPALLPTDRASSTLSAAQLAAGTIQLQDSDVRVTGEQATELLTLWLAYQEVDTRDTSSELETQALVDQITAAMTTQQLEAIQAMNLTASEMRSLTSSTSSNQAATEILGTEGMPGNVPSDGGMMRTEIVGAEVNTSGMAPMNGASVSTTSSEDNLVLSLVEPLVALLETQTA